MESDDGSIQRGRSGSCKTAGGALGTTRLGIVCMAMIANCNTAGRSLLLRSIRNITGAPPPFRSRSACLSRRRRGLCQSRAGSLTVSVREVCRPRRRFRDWRVVSEFVRQFALGIVYRRGFVRRWCRRGLRHLRGQCAQMVSRSAGPCRRSDCARDWRWHGRNRHPHSRNEYSPTATSSHSCASGWARGSLSCCYRVCCVLRRRVKRRNRRCG